MPTRLSLFIGAGALSAWCWLVLIRHTPAGWPHVLYALGIMLLLRWIALRDGTTA